MVIYDKIGQPHYLPIRYGKTRVAKKSGYEYVKGIDKERINEGLTWARYNEIDESLKNLVNIRKNLVP